MPMASGQNGDCDILLPFKYFSREVEIKNNTKKKFMDSVKYHFNLLRLE